MTGEKRKFAMSAVLFLGLILGLQHATEADHLAAVVSLASGQTRPRAFLLHGVSWGLGHATMLLAVAGLLLSFGRVLSSSLDGWLDFGVGVMLVGLGIHVVYRLWQSHFHIHPHQHGDGTLHLHAHSHAAGIVPHSASMHAHPHRERLPLRTFCVGLMHGMAGSAALMVLAASSIGTLAGAMSFVVLFALGSMIGMTLLTAVIALPLSLSARMPTAVLAGVQLSVGLITVAIGLRLVFVQFALSIAG